MEDLRINASLPQRMMTEPDLRWDLAATAAVTYGLFGRQGLLGNIRRMNGISDEEVDAGLADRSPSSRAYRHLLVTMPFRDSHIQADGRGRVINVDLSQWFGPTRLLNGQPDDSIVLKMLGNFMMTPVSGGIAEASVRNTLAQAGLMRQGPNPPRLLEGEGDALFSLGKAWQAGALPTAPLRIAEAVRRNGSFPNDVSGRLKPTEEPLTGGETAARIMGINAEPYTMPGVGEPSPSNIASEEDEIRRMDDLFRQLDMLIDRTPGQSVEAGVAQAEAHKSRMTPTQLRILDSIQAALARVGPASKVRTDAVKAGQAARQKQ